MSTYTQNLYHVIFGTKHRVPALPAPHRRDLFAYMTGTMGNLGRFVYRINGVEDHLHILVDIGPDLSPARFVRTIKTSSSAWLKGTGHFPLFRNWQEAYGAFTKSWADKDTIIEHIKRQEEHHRHETFLDEFRRLVEEAGLKWNDQYLP